MTFNGTTALQELKDLTEILRMNNSTTFKRSVLKKVSSPELIELIRLTYDTNTKFFLSIENVGKEDPNESDSLWDDPLPDWPQDVNPVQVFYGLAKREITGDAAVRNYKAARKALPTALQETFDLILERDLKAKVSLGLLQEAFPGTFSEFAVQLADKYEWKKVQTERVFLNRKLDGIRMILTYVGGVATAYSRVGKQYYTMDVVLQDFLKHVPKIYERSDFVLDGELCLVDDNGNEDFQGIVSLFRRKDFTIKNPRYVVFDILPYSDFLAGAGDTIYSSRFNELTNFVKNGNFDTIKLVESWESTKTRLPKELDGLLQDAVDKGWEGLMVKSDSPYKGKRNNALLKCKLFQDAEFEILNTENDYVDDGKGNKVYALSRITIKLDDAGHEVGVGSGFTHDERLTYLKYPELLIGKKATIKFFNHSQNQDGTPSLRFPIWKGLRESGE